MKVAQDLKIIVGILEVPKGAEDIECEIEVLRALEVSHVCLNKLDVQTLIRGTGSG